MKNARLLLAVLAVVAAGPAHADATDDFNALLDESWEWQLETDPMFASRLGDQPL